MNLPPSARFALRPFSGPAQPVPRAPWHGLLRGLSMRAGASACGITTLTQEFE